MKFSRFFGLVLSGALALSSVWVARADVTHIAPDGSVTRDSAESVQAADATQTQQLQAEQLQLAAGVQPDMNYRNRQRRDENNRDGNELNGARREGGGRASWSNGRTTISGGYYFHNGGRSYYRTPDGTDIYIGDNSRVTIINNGGGYYGGGSYDYYGRPSYYDYGSYYGNRGYYGYYQPPSIPGYSAQGYTYYNGRPAVTYQEVMPIMGARLPSAPIIMPIGPRLQHPQRPRRGR